MTQEEKQLLLKDLCARLPYGVKIQTWYGEIITSDLNTFPYSTEEMDKEGMWDQLDSFKPYLRPMSNMTEEEKSELNERFHNIGYFFTQEPPYDYGLMVQHADAGSIIISEFSEVYDWLLSHHFDYRGLIPMGLALEAPKDMYKTE